MRIRWVKNWIFSKEVEAEKKKSIEWEVMSIYASEKQG